MSTSSTLAREMRAMRAVYRVARAMLGRMMLRRNGAKPSASGLYPWAGSQRSSIANTYIRMYPITKMGTENPSTANTIVARSTNVPARHAANTPSGTATTMLRMMVATQSARVGSRRWPMSFATGRLEKIDTPRSPWASCPTQRANCTWMGWSRPSRARIFSMSAGLA